MSYIVFSLIFIILVIIGYVIYRIIVTLQTQQQIDTQQPIKDIHQLIENTQEPIKDTIQNTIKLLYPRIGRMPDKSPCDPGQRDDGVSCWSGVNSLEIKKTLFNRYKCRADEDNYAGLCYPKCKPDYKNIGLFCEPN